MPAAMRADDTIERLVADLRERMKRVERRKSGGSFDPNEDPVIIGANALTDDGGSPSNPTSAYTAVVVIGANSEGDANGVVAIGDTAIAEASHAVAIGYASRSEGAGAVSIGDNAGSHTTVAASAVSVGDHAQAKATDGVAIGHNSVVSGGYGVSIGPGSGGTNPLHHTTAALNGIAIGRESYAGESGIAIGYGAATDYDYISSTFTGSTKGTAVGYGSNASGNSDTAIGASAEATGGYGVALGDAARAYGDSATAVGTVTEATVENSTAVGAGAHAHHIHATALGANAATTDDYQTVVGGRPIYASPPGFVSIVGHLDLSNLPTSDPGISGYAWWDTANNVLAVSP